MGFLYGIAIGLLLGTVLLIYATEWMRREIDKLDAEEDR